MIYFLQPTTGGPIKIGFTANLPARHKALEAHYGRTLALLATMDGDREQEAEIHARFAHLRFGRTEQFRPEMDLLAFIDRPLLVSANPDAVEMMVTTKAVRLDLSPREHRQLRAVAGLNGPSMTSYAHSAVMRIVLEELEQRGIDL